MRKSRFKTLLLGLTAGVVYAFLVSILVTHFHENVSIAYIFVLPLILGAIPVLFSTKEQLKSYKLYLILPWGITLTFFFLSWAFNFEGMICLTIIIAPFLIVGTLGALIYRLIKLKNEGKGTKLYISLALPLVFLSIEHNIQPTDQIHTVQTTIEIEANQTATWDNLKNVKDIQPHEIETHFIHLIGIPKPISGVLDKEGVGGIRHITWEKGIKFEEHITNWDENNGFAYDINVDPTSIPPTTLDEHVMIGGKYFDVLKGSYKIDSVNETKCMVTLTCTYRVTTNLNFYSKLWADFILNDFNEMILEVIKKRSEANPISSNSDKVFTQATDCPVIKDTAAFITELREVFNLKLEDSNSEKDEITAFLKVQFYGSKHDYIFIEYDYKTGPDAAWPWKYQVILTSEGKMVHLASAIRYDFIEIFKNENPFLLTVSSTSKGNGGHEIYRISNDTLENLLEFNLDSSPRTYDAHEDNSINEPVELKPVIKDYNADGLNDISFNGKVVLIQGLTENGDWYDGETINGKSNLYSIDNPFKKIPVELIFLYDKQTRRFRVKENYYEKYGFTY